MSNIESLSIAQGDEDESSNGELYNITETSDDSAQNFDFRIREEKIVVEREEVVETTKNQDNGESMSMMDIIKFLRDSMQNMGKQMGDNLRDSMQNMQRLEKVIEESSNNCKESMQNMEKKMGDNLRDSMQNMEKKMGDNLRDSMQNMEKNMQHMEKNMQNMMTEGNAKMNDNMSIFRDEIKFSIESINQKLAENNKNTERLKKEVDSKFQKLNEKMDTSEKTIHELSSKIDVMDVSNAQCRLTQEELSQKLESFDSSIDQRLGDFKNKVREGFDWVKREANQTKIELKEEMEAILIEKLNSVEARKVDEQGLRSKFEDQVRKLQKDQADSHQQIRERNEQTLDQFRIEQRDNLEKALGQLNIHEKFREISESIGEIKEQVNQRLEISEDTVIKLGDYDCRVQNPNNETLMWKNKNNVKDEASPNESSYNPNQANNVDMNISGSLALRFMKLNVFRGEYSENPIEFLSSLDELFSLCVMSEKEKLAICSNHLHGNAKHWWQSLFDRPATYGDFKFLILTNFWGCEKQDSIKFQISQEKYSTNKGSYTSFFRSQAVKLKSLTAFPLSESQIVRLIRHNLPRGIEQILIAADRHTIEDVTELLDALEATETAGEAKGRPPKDRYNYPLSNINMSNDFPGRSEFRKRPSYNQSSRGQRRVIYSRGDTPGKTPGIGKPALVKKGTLVKNPQPSTSGITTILKKANSLTP